MYKHRSNLIIGFHGCDEETRNLLVAHPQNIKRSQELFDWLGHGFYIWENNYDRALQWARDKVKRGGIKKPSVLGVICTLDNCLDFTDSAFTTMILSYYEIMKRDFENLGKTLPQNRGLAKDEYHDMILRELDCAVIEYMHQKIREEIEVQIRKNKYSEIRYFDTVRGIFTEGGPAFAGAGIQLKNHIQICIRNLNCIKGLFIPRQDSVFAG
jgi:hypothetical protein